MSTTCTVKWQIVIIHQRHKNLNDPWGKKFIVFGWQNYSLEGIEMIL
jgi:hypothetical protein